MPAVKCSGCGRQTNTACSNAWEEKPLGEATECYQAFVNGKWVKGCGFDKAPLFLQKVYWREEWGKCPIKQVKKAG